MTAAAADFIEAKIPGNGKQPGGKLGGGLITRGGFPGLHKYILGEIFRLDFIAQRPPCEIDDGLFVLLDQFGKSRGVALLRTKHQGGIGIEVSRHDRFRLGQHRSSLKVAANSQ